MDEKDKRLIAVLRENARLSLSALARTLGLSRSTVQDRLARLEERGVIAGYTVRLGHDTASQEVRANVMIKIFPKAQDDVVVFCRKLPEIVTLHTISGEFDLIAILRAENTAALDKALDLLGRHKGIERTQSSVVLSTKFERA